jgi:hypothetical protein
MSYELRVVAQIERGHIWSAPVNFATKCLCNRHTETVREIKQDLISAERKIKVVA